MTLRRVTVIGGSGFVGRYVVQHVAATGAVVRVGVRQPVDAYFLQPLGDVGQIVSVRADVRDPVSLRVACEGAEAVINLVGILYESGKSTFAAVHAEGAGNVAAAARAAGTRRFVQMSAIGADLRSPAEYARSKAAGEKAVRKAFPGATVLRPSIIFGPEDDFFNRFARLARIAPVLPVFPCRFQPVYVGDVADAVMAVLAKPGSEGQTYELGGPQIYTFREILELIGAETGRRRLLVPVPIWLALLEAFFLERLPGPPLLTRDQVRLLERDNVVAKTASTFADLGIAPRAAEAILPTYLAQYRRGGPFHSAVTP